MSVKLHSNVHVYGAVYKSDMYVYVVFSAIEVMIGGNFCKWSLPYWFINPQCACTARVTVVVLYVCMCVCLSVTLSARYSGSTRD